MKPLSLIHLVIILLFSIVILLPVSPIYRQVPAVDTSVFLYIGERILEGGVPYRDAWDHKQPLVYLLYAFAQWITPGSLWGAWLLILTSVFTTAWACYVVVEKFGGNWLACLSVTGGLLGLHPILWGGSIEELAIASQALSLFAFVQFHSTVSVRKKVAFGMLLGFSIGFAFFLKQTMVAAGAAIMIYLSADFILRRRWKDWFLFLAVIIGILSVALPLVLYLFASGAWNDYINAAFIFNSRYAGLGLLEQIKAVLDAIEYMSGLPGLFLAMSTWFACTGFIVMQSGSVIINIIRNKTVLLAGFIGGLSLIVLSVVIELFEVGQQGFGLVQILFISIGSILVLTYACFHSIRFRDYIIARLRTLPEIKEKVLTMPVILFYFPITLFLITFSGRNYVYYFIAFIPYMMTAYGCIGAVLLSSAGNGLRKTVWALILAIWLGMAIMPAIQLASIYREPTGKPLPDIVNYVQANSSPDETILAWGKSSTYIYPLTGRKAPTRHFYQAAVFEEGYNTDFRIIDETLTDIEAKPPRLFLYYYEKPIEVLSGQCPLVFTDVPNSEGSIFRYICENYAYQGQVGDFLVFRMP